jgi:purine-nucleoside phosphorylase
VEKKDNPLNKAYSAASFIEETAGKEWEIAIILGSGLSNGFEPDGQILGFDQVPGFMRSAVKGHPRKLVFCRIGGKKTIIMQGRYHCYEGYSAAETAIPIFTFSCLGVKNIITTNAAGALNPAYAVGDLMAITDHINLTAQSPLAGIQSQTDESLFVNLSNAYDAELRSKLVDISKSTADLKIHQGVYVAVNGPNYETLAELNFIKLIGGDAVGMSTVHEVIAARFSEMKILGVSVITNQLSRQKIPVSHEEVLRQSKTVSPKLFALLEETVKMF